METSEEYAFASRGECLAALERNASQEQISCVICTSETAAETNWIHDVHQELTERCVVLHDCHTFGERCIRRWLNKHNTCPICRKKLFPQAPEPSTAQTPWADLSDEARGAATRELLRTLGHPQLIQREAAQRRIARLAGPRVPMHRERTRTARLGRQIEQDVTQERAWLDSPRGLRFQRQNPWFRGTEAARRLTTVIQQIEQDVTQERAWLDSPRGLRSQRQDPLSRGREAARRLTTVIQQIEQEDMQDRIARQPERSRVLVHDQSIEQEVLNTVENIGERFREDFMTLMSGQQTEQEATQEGVPEHLRHYA